MIAFTGKGDRACKRAKYGENVNGEEFRDRRKTRRTEAFFGGRRRDIVAPSRLRSYPLRLHTGRENSEDRYERGAREEEKARDGKIANGGIEVSLDFPRYSTDSDRSAQTRLGIGYPTRKWSGDGIRNSILIPNMGFPSGLKIRIMSKLVLLF